MGGLTLNGSLARVALALAAALALADASIVTLGLPSILSQLDTTVEGVALVLGVYTAVLALALLPMVCALAQGGRGGGGGGGDRGLRTGLARVRVGRLDGSAARAARDPGRWRRRGP